MSKKSKSTPKESLAEKAGRLKIAADEAAAAYKEVWAELRESIGPLDETDSFETDTFIVTAKRSSSTTVDYPAIQKKFGAKVETTVVQVDPAKVKQVLTGAQLAKYTTTTVNLPSLSFAIKEQ